MGAESSSGKGRGILIPKKGYRINKMTLPDKKGNRLGESNCLKIIVNHYRYNYQKLKEISLSRGTNLEVLLTSYNLSYRNDTLN